MNPSRHPLVGSRAVRVCTALVIALLIAMPGSAAAAGPTGSSGSTLATNPTGAPISPSGARSTITLDSDLRLPSNISAWAIDQYLAANTPLPPLGTAFKGAEATFHVNALYLLAHAMHESDYGRSYIAQTDKNLFGWTAYDRDPVLYATRFASFQDSITYVAQQVAQTYLDPAGAYYGGAPTLRGMYRYATNPGWGANIVSIANSIVLPTLAGRGLSFKASIPTTSLVTGSATSVTIQASPASALPNGLQLAGRVRVAGAPATGGFVLTGATSQNGRFIVPIQVGPNPGQYVMDFVLVDEDGRPLPASDAVPISPTPMQVVPLFNVGFTADKGDTLTVHVTNSGTTPVPALGPKIGTIVAGRPPTDLVAWFVRAGMQPIALQRTALPADLAPKASWDAAIDLSALSDPTADGGAALTLQAGDVIVVRLEVPDPTGVPVATLPAAFQVADAPAEPGIDGSGLAGAASAGVRVVALAATDPNAASAVSMIAPPPGVQSAIAAGAPVTP
jgi:hypothetical protein